MKNLVVCSLLIVGAWAMPQGYNVPVPEAPLDFGGGAALAPAVSPISCGGGLVLDTYTGECVAPVVTRNIYVYAAPEQPRAAPAPVNVPPPKVDYNIVFVRSPESNAAAEPIIVPPPQQRTLVYVLSKKQAGGQRVIEVPAGPASNPEVYFVNYGPGENPQLPGGVDLQSALGAAASAPGSAGFGGATGFGGGAGFGGAGQGATGFIVGGGDTFRAGDFGGNTGSISAGDAGQGAGNFGASTSFGGAGQGAGGFGGAGQGAGGFGGAGQGAGGFGGADQGFGGNSGFGGVGLGGVGLGSAPGTGGVPLPGGQNQV